MSRSRAARIEERVPPPSKFRLVVFDLDGTLVDSRRDLANAANATLEHYGCPTHSEEAIGRMVGDGAATLVARAFAAAKCPQPPDALQRFLAIYNAGLLDFTRPYDGIVEVLSALEHDVVLAVLTNKPADATHRILEGLDLKRFFGPRVLGGDGPFPRKPDPTGLVSTIVDAGVRAAETLMVGDSVVDWQTARSAGTAACLVEYGFGLDGLHHVSLAVDDYLIRQPMELLALV